jgi:hypothetical protein
MSHHSEHEYRELTRRDKRFGDSKRTVTPYKRPRKGGRTNEGIENDEYDERADEYECHERVA